MKKRAVSYSLVLFLFNVDLVSKAVLSPVCHRGEGCRLPRGITCYTVMIQQIRQRDITDALTWVTKFSLKVHLLAALSGTWGGGGGTGGVITA